MKTTNILQTFRSFALSAICLFMSQNVVAQNQIQGHDYVDLGLPSGLLWATCNIGADSPEQYGEYYAWGEIVTKSSYEWYNYQHGTWGANADITAYGARDGRYTLANTNDVATQKWGEQWSVPTKAQFNELIRNCTWRKTSVNGIICMEGKGPNGNQILLPAAGAMNHTDCEHAGTYGTYWINEINANQYFKSNVLFFSTKNSYPELWDNGLRYIGNSVRAVSRQQNNGILDGGSCGWNLRYTIYDDLSMKVEGTGDSYWFSDPNDYQKGQYWNQVKSVSLPEGMTYINRNFLCGSSITSITIPNSVYGVWDYAFKDCSNLTSMYVPAVPPSCGISPFSGITSTCTLYVPAGSKSAYQSANEWKDFVNIVEYAASNELIYTSNALYLEDIEVVAGQQYQIAIKMKNNMADLTGLQFVMQLPEGVNVVKDEDDEYLVTLNPERATTSHTVSANVEPDGKLRVMVVSITNKVFKGTTGDIVYITLNVAPNASVGQYPLTLQDVKLAQKSNKIAAPNFMSECTLIDYQMGDVNHDRAITISDAIGVINLWTSKDVNGIYSKHADMNGDGKINISDVVRIIDKVNGQ